MKSHLCAKVNPLFIAPGSVSLTFFIWDFVAGLFRYLMPVLLRLVSPLGPQGQPESRITTFNSLATKLSFC